jgi:phage gp36-like protein
MAYCTLADLKEQIREEDLIQLTDDESLEIINEDRINRAIADADAEIDGYCSTRFATLPFSSVPVFIRKCSVDIAIYNLFSRRRGAPEDRLQRYKDTIKFLSNVANGTISLGGDAPAEDDDAGPAATTVKSDRIFSMGKLSDSSVGSLDNF